MVSASNSRNMGFRSHITFASTFIILLAFSNADVIVEQSYGERIANAIWGFLFGILLFVLSLICMWVVEQDAVDYYLLLSRCRRGTRKIDDSSFVDFTYDGRPVFINGITNLPSDCEETSKDKETGYVGTSGSALRLARKVEVYQWVERTKKEEKKTTYHYNLEWSETDHNSKSFVESVGHYNPPRDPAVSTKTTNCSTAQVGAYQLCPEQVEKLHHFSICPINVVGSQVKMKIERGIF